MQTDMKSPSPAMLYAQCMQCPRKCKADRLSAPYLGFCHESADLRVAFAGLHFGEEPLVTGTGGSGTIFFTGCTLRCKFCQNYQISQQGLGRAVTSAEFTRICLDLQSAGAENINLVTGSHHIPKIAVFLQDARAAGVTIPFCWNSSAYESVEMLELLRGLVTIWLPDLKTLDSALSQKLFAAPDYPEAATKAIQWMIDNNPLVIEEVSAKKNPLAQNIPAQTSSSNGTEPASGTFPIRPNETYEKITSGVIVRHLFLPGTFEQTADVLAWLKEHADGKAITSLMNQYTPIPAQKGKITEIEDRLVSAQEDADIQDLIEAYDFEYLFYQELSDDTSWLPDFTRAQPFSNKLAKPLWHC